MNYIAHRIFCLIQLHKKQYLYFQKKLLEKEAFDHIIMTKYRQVERTTKGGSILQHYDIDWIYYAKLCVHNVWFSCTTRTLQEAEEWIAQTRRDNYAPRLPKCSKKKKVCCIQQ